MTKTIKGYKVFNPDWTCRGFQYEVGEVYEHNGQIGLCEKGFHFCVEAVDCFDYCSFNSDNKVAEVEAIGSVKSDSHKSVTDKIRIIKELDWSEVLKLVNTGKDCTGNRNSGDYNSGDKNSGNWNSGNWNSGDWNSGDSNLGDWNSGDSNSGNWNSGDWNSGRKNSGDSNSGNRNSGDSNSGDRNSGGWNSGDWNSGDWNSGSGNSGVFCTEEAKIKIFDMESNMTLSEWKGTEASKILSLNFELNVWVEPENMTDEEKEQHPSYQTDGGCLRVLSFKEACKNMWGKLTDREKEVVKNIPNFDEKKFKKITGIDIKE